MRNDITPKKTIQLAVLRESLGSFPHSLPIAPARTHLRGVFPSKVRRCPNPPLTGDTPVTKPTRGLSIKGFHSSTSWFEVYEARVNSHLRTKSLGFIVRPKKKTTRLPYLWSQKEEATGVQGDRPNRKWRRRVGLGSKLINYPLGGGKKGKDQQEQPPSIHRSHLTHTQMSPKPRGPTPKEWDKIAAWQARHS